MSINYTTISTELGWVLVAGTERGVCSVQIGDSEAKLKKAIRAEFPEAQMAAQSSHLSRWAEEVARRVRGEKAQSQIPLDLKATGFQKRVWRALEDIPRGTTRSYQEIARTVGKPRAYRAVANACASNPVAIVIPCHRVIRSDGALGGYGGGVARKKELLRRESER